MTYAEKLKRPEWQRKRLEVLERDKWTCQGCGHKDKSLQVHHRLYITGAAPWMYVDAALITLCDDCHGEWHNIQDRIAATLCELTADEYLKIGTDFTLEQLGEYLRALGLQRDKMLIAENAYDKGKTETEDKWRAMYGETKAAP